MTTMLVASAGGHLKQLSSLAPRLRQVEMGDVLWVTFDTPQSRSILADQNVMYVPYVGSRELRKTMSLVGPAAEAMERSKIDLVVSTGASVAVSFFMAARARGIPCHYIESATRVSGPSLSGKMVRLLPGVSCYTQHQQWATKAWRFRGSIFDGFEVRPRLRSGRVERVVVTLGSAEAFGFRRLLERLVAILPSDAEVLWQTGSTDVRGLPIEARPAVAARTLEAAMRDADVVVAHAGTGSALASFDSGQCPVLVPRSRARHEHVDDHQRQLAANLAVRDLALAREVDDLVLDDLVEASQREVRRVQVQPPFVLSA